MPTVQTNDIETHYEVRGTGPPIVFIHGALADHTSAEQQLAAFSDSHTAIAYDVRGHGETRNPGNQPYSIDLLAEDLHAFIGSLGLDNPILCGVSMGGMIAQGYASRYPDQLSGLVLADTFSPVTLGRRDRIERTLLLNAVTELVRRVGYNRAKGVLMWLGRELEGKTTGSLRTEAFPDMDTVAATNAFQAVSDFRNSDIDLPSITVPTLILYGEHEPALIRRHVSTLATEIPDSTVREVPDAGHATPWDNPEFFNSTIRTFLANRVLVGSE